ncbi:MAG: hypothetical protein D6735_05295 [Acidobacteria bacterium]|nr:MAG: hypothetical protein D6735_05295 [Acidobacteriota bacterium]
MIYESLIATLEQSLGQTRNAQNLLLARLREVEAEAEKLRQEIQALEDSATQTEQAIRSLLMTMRSSGTRYEIESEEITNSRQAEPPNKTVRQTWEKVDSRMHNSAHRLTDISQIRQANSFSTGISSPIIEPMNRRFADRTIAQACTLLLREAGRPLHVNEIYRLLVAGGMQFKGNNPTISIAVSLNRNRRFKKVAPGTFDLVIKDASQIAS